jgi:ATP-binding cassette subfamily C protein
LDVVGVLLLAGVGIVAVQAMQGGTAWPSALDPAIQALTAQGLDILQISLVFASIAAFLLVGKSFASALLARAGLRFLARRQVEISFSLAQRFVNQSIDQVQHDGSLKSAYAIVQGASIATVGILGSAATLASESFLLLLFSLVLLLVDPVVTLVSGLYLATVAILVHRTLGAWSERLGVVSAETTVMGNRYIQDLVVLFREIFVLGRRGLYLSRTQQLVRAGAAAQADSGLIVQIPKYVFESAILVGAVALAAFLLLTSTSAVALGTLILFLAAASRVAPAILRLQGALISLRASTGSSQATFELAERLAAVSSFPGDSRFGYRRSLETNRQTEFVPSVCAEKVSVWYEGASRSALSEISLSVKPGCQLAVVGPTGAGKSTLADTLLGILPVSSGDVLIGGLPPKQAIDQWPGQIAYVPQSAALIEGTVRDNVALGLPRDLVSDDEVWQALESASLADFLFRERQGLDTLVGERGVRFSGGQKQRIGLARALLTDPSLLVLDEATSALDAETENAIATSLNRLKGACTLIIIAHRLSTIRNSDLVAYLDAGSLVTVGTFDEVRRYVAIFDKQAALSGL